MDKINCLIFSLCMVVSGFVYSQTSYLEPFTPSISVASRTGEIIGKAGYSIPSGNNFWRLFQWGDPASIIPAVFPYGQRWEIYTSTKRLQFYPLDNGRSNVYEVSAANLPCPHSGSNYANNEVNMFLSPEGLLFPHTNLAEMG